MASPIGIGMVGAGGGFGRFIAEAIEEAGEGRLVAVAGSHPDRTAQAAQDLGIAEHYIDYQRFLADPAVEMVIVSTPPHLHAPMGIAAVEAGKALFIEKPVSTSVASGRSLLSAIRASGQGALVDFVMRYNPLFDLLATWTHDKALGSLRYVDFQNMAADESLAPEHWFWDRGQSGGILVEHGVHFFDIYGHLIDAPPIGVRGLSTVRIGTDQQDQMVAQVGYENGVLATYYHAFDKMSRAERTTAVLDYDRGRITVDGWIAMSLEIDAFVDEKGREQLARAPGMRLETVEQYDGERIEARGAGHEYKVTEHVRGSLSLPRSKQDAYRTQVADALRDLFTLMKDPSHTPRVSVVDGVRAVAIAEAATAGGGTKGESIAQTWKSLE